MMLNYFREYNGYHCYMLTNVTVVFHLWLHRCQNNSVIYTCKTISTSQNPVGVLYVVSVLLIKVELFNFELPKQDSKSPILCHKFAIHNWQGCDLTKVKNPEKWVAAPSFPLVWRTKPHWTSWMFNFGGFTDSTSSQGLHILYEQSAGNHLKLLSKHFC